MVALIALALGAVAVNATTTLPYLLPYPANFTDSWGALFLTCNVHLFSPTGFGGKGEDPM